MAKVVRAVEDTAATVADTDSEKQIRMNETSTKILIEYEKGRSLRNLPFLIVCN